MEARPRCLGHGLHLREQREQLTRVLGSASRVDQTVELGGDGPQVTALGSSRDAGPLLADKRPPRRTGHARAIEMQDRALVIGSLHGGPSGEVLGARAALSIPGLERGRERGIRARRIAGGHGTLGSRELDALTGHLIGHSCACLREWRTDVLTCVRPGESFNLQDQTLVGRHALGLRRRLGPLSPRLGHLAEVLETAGILGMLFRVPHGVVGRTAPEAGGEQQRGGAPTASRRHRA